MTGGAFRSLDGAVFSLSDPSILALESYRQVGDTTVEAGGLLLGRLIDGSADVVVDEATGPHAHDRRSRFAFFRRRNPAQGLVNRAWAGSSGTRIYLGEWHSHPEDDPTPSDPDYNNWRRILREVKCEHHRLFFLIVGRRRIRVWEGRRSDGTITQLDPDARADGEVRV